MSYVVRGPNNSNRNSNYNSNDSSFLGAILGIGMIGAVAYWGFKLLVFCAKFTFSVCAATYYAAFPSFQSVPNSSSNSEVASTLNTTREIHRTVHNNITSFNNAITVHPHVLDNRIFISVTKKNGESYSIEIPQGLYTSFTERFKINYGSKVKIDYSDRINAKIERFKNILNKNKELLDGEPILVANGNLLNTNFQHIFENKLVFRSSKLDVNTIHNNLSALYHSENISNKNTSIVNGIPNSQDELRNIKLNTNDWGNWQGIHQNWSTIINKYNFTQNTGKTAITAIESLKSQANVLVIIAHSDSHSIYFPDGSSLTVSDINHIKRSIERNRPLVTLFSCETAKVQSDGLLSFSQALIEAGAKAVIAPTGEIGASSSSNLLEYIFENSKKEKPIEAIFNATKKSGIHDLENWIGFKFKSTFYSC